MSNINSYSREKLNDMSPHDMFCYLYGVSVPEKLGQRKIPANEITLKPSLFKNSPFWQTYKHYDACHRDRFAVHLSVSPIPVDNFFNIV